MATLPTFSKGRIATLIPAGLLGLLSTSPADEPFQAPPAPPALVVPHVPELQQGGAPAKPEPGKPRGRTPRGNTPGTLIENGESGSGGVEDHTDSTYELLQGSISAQGDHAFHLATPDGHWFKPTPSVAVTSGCKLFFQSRLGWATSAQTATVQISTDAGANWSSTVWTQSGTGDSGESGFALHEIDLSSFTGNTVQIRFLYAFSGGSFFPQTSSGAGWYVDNIQVGSELSKERYVFFGEPTDDEQHYLEFINRARASASTEAARLRDVTDPQITSAYAGFAIDVNDIPNQFAWHVSSACIEEVGQPLAFNSKLLQMARLHSEDMFTNIFQGHVSSASPPAPYQPGDTLSQRRTRIGYSSGVGENVYAYSKSVAFGHAGFLVDWGNTTNTGSSCYNPAFVGQGMQNPPGHRLSTHNASYREIGVGVINGTNGSVGPQLVTQNLGLGGGVVITGVAYQDANGNSFYDPGEGVGGIRVETPGSAFFSLTSASGGYAIPVDTDGTHPVTFSGGGFATSTVSAVISGGNNAKLDHLPTGGAFSYDAWAISLGVTGGQDGDHDQDGVPNLVEYALSGFDPLSSDSHLLPSLVTSGGTSTLTIAKNSAATDVTYAVQTSTDLTGWGDSGFTVLNDDSTTLEVSITTSAAPALFVRILVTSTQ